MAPGVVLRTMPRFLPIFPLTLVAYPGETVNLHIFEPRYKELIRDVRAGDGLFAMPAYLEERVVEYATVLRLESVEKTYPDGKMDIRTVGTGVVRILELLREVPDKMYAAAVVDERPDVEDHDATVASALYGYWRQVQQLLRIEKPDIARPGELRAYAIAHLVGLSMKQEYELLTYARETDRQKYLVAHLKESLPVLAEAERARQRAMLNGHFRHLDPPVF